MTQNSRVARIAVPMLAAVSWLIASRAAMAANLGVFVTSVAGTGDLSSWTQAGAHAGLDAGDAICRSLATTANLPNAGQYVAWLSTTATDAYCHVAGFAGKVSNQCGQASLPDAGPWFRRDGQPFVRSGLDMLTTGTVLHPIELDELDSKPVQGNADVWTGTSAGGAGGGACQDWTSAASDQHANQIGEPVAGFTGWTAWSGSSCDQPDHLYCFEQGSGDPVPPFEAPGAYAFVTSVTGNGDLGSWPQAGAATGLAAGDAICRSVAASGHLPAPESFVAWLSAPGSPAADRLTVAGPWRRADGVEIAPSKTALISGADLETDLEQNELGARVAVFAATGSHNNGQPADPTCNGWTSASAGFSLAGGWSDAANYFWTEGAGGTCDGAGLHLFCFANVVTIFADGFESGDASRW